MGWRSTMVHWTFYAASWFTWPPQFAIPRNNHLYHHTPLWRADSRGLRICAGNSGPISSFTVDWLQTIGVSMPAAHRFPMPVSAADLQAARLVVAVKEAEHRPLLQQGFPDWTERVEYWHIDDLDFAMPELALPKLTAKIEELLRRLGEPGA